MIAFSQEDMAEPLAHIVENDVILGAIMRRLRCAPTPVEVRFNSKVKSYVIPKVSQSGEADKHPWVKLDLGEGGSIHTQFLVRLPVNIALAVLWFYF